jgi:hypothetical protein
MEIEKKLMEEFLVEELESRLEMKAAWIGEVKECDNPEHCHGIY